MTQVVGTLPRRQGTAGELLKLGAFLRRDILTSVSYRFALVSEVAAIGVAVFMFSLLGRMIDRSVLPTFGGARPTFMEFVAVGIVVAAFIQLGIGRVTKAIEGEQIKGTLESLLMTPTSTTTVLLGSVAYDLLYVPVRAALSLIAIALVFGLDYHVSGLPSAGLHLLLFIPFVWGLGMTSAALELTFRRGAGVFGIGITLLTIGSGAYFPLAVLPGPFAAIAPYNPIWIASQGMREALLLGGSASIDKGLLVLAALSALSLLVGLVVFRLGMRRERESGSLGLY